RIRREAREARIARPDETPGDAEQQQREDRVAEAEVPGERVPAEVRRDDRAGDADGERPVEEPGGEIPDADAHGARPAGRPERSVAARAGARAPSRRRAQGSSGWPSSLRRTGLTRSSRFTPSRIAMPAATKIDE